MVYKVGIVIPWHDSGDMDRLNAFTYVYNYLNSLGIGQIFIGENFDQPLNRAKMRNNGAHKAIESGCDVLFFNDADCVIPKDQIVQSIQEVGEGLTFAHDHWMIDLTIDQTKQVLKGMDVNSFYIPTKLVRRSGNITPQFNTGQGFSMKTSTFLTIGGQDEAFRGWGYEDNDFASIIDRTIERNRSTPGTFYTLYHKPTYANASERGPASTSGTDENTLTLFNRFRMEYKSSLNIDEYREMSGVETIGIIVPVTRPHCAETFMNNTQSPVYAICDDKPNIQAWSAAGATIINTNLKTFAQRCNYAYTQTKEPWLLFVGEDVRFDPNWKVKSLKYLNRFGVIGTNDLYRSSYKHSPHLIISRKYIQNFGGSWDGPNIVFHNYIHNYPDTETIYLAQRRKVWGYNPEIIIEHLHHANNKAQIDGVYEIGNSSFNTDKEEYTQRLRRYRNMR
jgi:hypothetical protein